MSIQCGICKNIMPSGSFLSHTERKHSMIEHVPYVKLSDDQARNGSVNAAATVATAAAAIAGPLVKCRFCPNRIPKENMERHLQRCHIECHLCGKTLLKSSRAKHMEQKHGINNTIGSISTTSNSNLPELAVLSQSKSSMQSDSDESMSASNRNFSADFNSPTVQMPYQSYAASLSSSASATPSPTPPPPSIPSPAIESSVNQPHRHSSAQEPNVIHVDVWQLSRYIRQGRVYNSNGWLYLRNSSIGSI